MRYLFLLVLCLPLAAASPPSLLDILSDELQRNFTVLRAKGDPPPYFIGYAVTEEENQVMAASLGSLSGEGKNRTRLFDVSVRVGSPKLDNYHVVKGERGRFTSGAIVPLDDVPDALRRRVWIETDRSYRLASRRLIEIKSNEQVKVKAADNSDDFSMEAPATYQEPPPTLVYAARVTPGVAHGIDDVDRVMRWGFGWELGPFEIMDAIGMRPREHRLPPAVCACPIPTRRTFSLVGSHRQAPRSVCRRQPPAT